MKTLIVSIVLMLSACATTTDYRWICKSDKAHCSDVGYEVPMNLTPYALYLQGKELCPHGVVALARDLNRGKRLIVCR